MDLFFNDKKYKFTKNINRLKVKENGGRSIIYSNDQSYWKQILDAGF